jgi:hypothetical protein
MPRDLDLAYCDQIGPDPQTKPPSKFTVDTALLSSEKQMTLTLFLKTAYPEALLVRL